jgi:hypothetical protein
MDRSLRLIVTLAVTFAAGTAAAQTARPRSRPRPASRPAVATPTPRPEPTKAPAGLAIAHEEKTCLVVGRYPQLRACMTPAGDVAKADMYFRPEKTTLWYRVIFKKDDPAAGDTCYTATLPKPTKQLVDTNVFLYAAGTSRQMGESRTREYPARVVASESDCGEKPVAPYVPSASVQVFPSVPAGFTVGGGSALPFILGGGAAAAGGGALIAMSGGGGDGPSGSDATPTPAPTAAATPTPTPTVGSDLPPTLVCRTVPDPAEGPAPLSVELNLCRSEDPEGRPLTYRFDFGDGGSTSGTFCRETHSYGSPGSFTARLCVTDGTHPEQCCSEKIRVTAAPPVTGTPPPGGGSACASPTITIDDPRPGFSITVGTTYTVRASPAASGGIGRVEFRAVNDATGAAASQTVTSPPYEWPWRTPLTGVGPTTVSATVFDKCPSGVQTATALVSGNVTTFILGSVPDDPGVRAFVVSDLEVASGAGRIVDDGGHLALVRAGRSVWQRRALAGENRIEAQLVEGDAPGLWRFHLQNGRFRAGSVRILEGEPALLTADTIVFRLRGGKGERLAFTFDTSP